MKMKIHTLLIIMNFIVCCSSIPSETIPTDTAEKESATGYCNQGIIDQLNSGELYLSYYKSKGLSEARYLIHAHRTYSSVINRYSKISCLARDRESGAVQIINEHYVQTAVDSILFWLNNEYRSCKAPERPKTPRETEACNEIDQFFKVGPSAQTYIGFPGYSYGSAA